ncbi:hypothetical protein PBY51_005567 [Eleginops maclovinus]|uniref:Uncharacterized protein n=1 Tax=Eleginops maclovinus TaxID=56733 RepID=A0AAN7X0M8_ELEMC|nr:hypothetical protein PBY51_005567 [Eleginops maclovinus]
MQVSNREHGVVDCCVPAEVKDTSGERNMIINNHRLVYGGKKSPVEDAVDQYVTFQIGGRQRDGLRGSVRLKDANRKT